MSATLSETKSRLSSENVDVLKQCLDFARRSLVHENERGKAAETRATVMFGILGVIGTLIIPQTRNLATNIELIDQSLLCLILLTACLFFLVKSLFYAIYTISISKRYRLEAQMVFDFQNCSHVDALRKEISGVLWEYEHAIPSNSRRLFYLQRCQRSGLVSIVFLVLFGLASIDALSQWISFSTRMSIDVGLLLGIIFFVLDPLVEDIEGIWRK